MTLQRVGLCLWVFSALACSDGAAAPLQRPSPSTEPAAAVVLHVVGAVQVTPTTGAAFTAAPPQDLVESDLLTPAEGAFVVVGLTNGYLIRIDDTGPLKVGQILMRKAPPTSRNYMSQLDDLLEPAEQIPSGPIADRAAAWRHMKRAGETAGRGPAKERSIASSEAVAPSPSAGAGPGANMAPKPVAQAPLPPAVEPQKSTPKRKAGPREEVQDSVRAKKDAAPPPPEAGVADDAMSPAPAQAPAAPPPTPEPGVQAAFGTRPTTTTAMPVAPFLGGGVAACLDETAMVHSLPVAELVLLLEVKGGIVKRVRMSGAVPPLSCATELVGTPAPVVDGWLRLSR